MLSSRIPVTIVVRTRIKKISFKERRLAHASKEASEISELYNSEREQWILEQDGHVKKVKGLEEALSEVSNYKRQLAKELEQVKGL